MKKKLSFLCIILLAASLFFSKGAGNTNTVTFFFAKSDKFTEDEINDAMDCVKKKFKDFK